MARFVCHIDRKKVDFNDIPNGQIKSLFANLREAIDLQLHSQQCKTHHLEPTISLFSENERFSGYAIGGCCQEFIDIISPLVKPNIPVDSSAVTFARTSKYTTIR